jgi:phosphoribosylglycinamide formyltransferase-1
MAFAKDANIPCHIVKKEKNDAGELFSETIFSLCRQHDIQLVVMGGFLKHLMIPDDFADRVINIHPSLIPAFSGQGFYGDRVHQAVLDYGCKVSGCTVHFVDNQFDHGPIISQQTVDVVEGDDAQQLQKRIFAQECHLYPRVVQAFALGDVKREGRWVWITLPDSK